jgi:hypothetical protein
MPPPGWQRHRLAKPGANSFLAVPSGSKDKDTAIDQRRRRAAISKITAINPLS